MENDKWIYDVEAGELINLKNVDCIYKSDSVAYSGDQVSIVFFSKGKEFYLHYDSITLRDNAFKHYINETNAKELNAKQKPLTL